MSGNQQHPWDSQFPEDGGWGGIELGLKGQIRRHAGARLLVETQVPPLGHLALCVYWGVGGLFCVIPAEGHVASSQPPDSFES